MPVKHLRHFRRALYWRVRQLWGSLWNHFSLALLNFRAARSKTRFAITHSYGRTGNNIQQVLIAIAHAEVFRGVLDVERDSLVDGRLVDLINSFSLDFSPGLQKKVVFNLNFFTIQSIRFAKKIFPVLHSSVEFFPAENVF